MVRLPALCAIVKQLPKDVNDSCKNVHVLAMDPDRNRNESVRLISFHECQSPYMRPGLLAEGGFFSIGRFDVRCAFCGIEFIDWAEEEILSDHVKYSPACPLLKNSANHDIPITQQQNDITPQTSNSENNVAAALTHVSVRDDLYVQPDTTGMVPKKKVVNRKWCETCNKYINKANWWKHVKTTRHRLAFAEELMATEAADPVAAATASLVLAGPSTSLAAPTTLDLETSVLPSAQNNVATPIAADNHVVTNTQPVLEEEQSNPNTGEEAARFTDEEYTRMCKVCYSNELYILFLPCRHIMACESCARHLKTCGICCQKIKQTMRVFIP